MTGQTPFPACHGRRCSCRWPFPDTSCSSKKMARDRRSLRRMVAVKEAAAPGSRVEPLSDQRRARFRFSQSREAREQKDCVAFSAPRKPSSSSNVPFPMPYKERPSSRNTATHLAQTRWHSLSRVLLADRKPSQRPGEQGYCRKSSAAESSHEASQLCLSAEACRPHATHLRSQSSHHRPAMPIARL